jgi:hypothetical protein
MTLIDLPFGAQVEEQPDVFEADGQIGAITLHRPLALSRLLAQYRELANIPALTGILATEVQELENAIIEVIVSRHILYANDAQLDLLGAIVGERRDGKGNALYRKFIQARVLINRSYGRVKDILAVLLAVDDSVPTFSELGTAFIRVTYSIPVASAEVRRAIPDLVRQARAAGVGASVIQPTRANWFRFKWTGEANLGGRGFSYPGSLEGGHLSTYSKA